MKKWISKNKKQLLIAVVISAVLTAAYFSGTRPTKNTAVQESSAVSVVSEIIRESQTEKNNIDNTSSEKISALSSIAENSLQSSISEKSVDESQKEEEKKIPETTEISSEASANKAESSTTVSFAESSDESIIVSSEEKIITHVSENSADEKLTESKDESATEISNESVIVSSSAAVKNESDNKCFITIDCHTAVSDSRLNKRTKALLPEDGIIISEKTVSFSDGESVFDILKRSCEENGISLEFSTTPLYGGAYIEGIGNLYEFDCGSISGWMYSVNGEFPAVGCSDYKVSKNDRISFIYSCDLGSDIGNEYRG